MAALTSRRHAHQRKPGHHLRGRNPNAASPTSSTAPWSTTRFPLWPRRL